MPHRVVLDDNKRFLSHCLAYSRYKIFLEKTLFSPTLFSQRLGPPLRYSWPAAPSPEPWALGQPQGCPGPPFTAPGPGHRAQTHRQSPQPTERSAAQPPTTALDDSTFLPQLRTASLPPEEASLSARLARKSVPGLAISGFCVFRSGGAAGVAGVRRAGARPPPLSCQPRGPPLTVPKPPGSTEVSEARTEDLASFPPQLGVATLPLAFGALVSFPCNRRVELKLQGGRGCAWARSQAFR